MEKTAEIKKRLLELIKRADDLKKDLDQLNNVLLYSGVLDEKKKETPPVPEKKEIVEEKPPQPQIIIPPVPKPEPKKDVPIMQQIKPPDYQKKEKPVPPPPPLKKKTFFERNPDLEKFIGERLITFIGIGILVIGIAFFVKYAIDKEWINEIGRTSIGILAGGLLVGIAHRLRKSFRVFSSVLAGGGVASLYFTVTYAFQVYHLFPQAAAFGILIAITLFTVMLSIGYDRMELAILAIIGGYGTPLMVATGQGNFNVLCTYVLILNGGMLLLSAFRKWQAVNILSFFFTVLIFSFALALLDNKTDPPYFSAMVFATLYYFSFFLMNIYQNLKQGIAFKFWEFLQLLTISLLYYAAGYFILQKMGLESLQGLFTLLVAVFNFGFAFVLYRRQGTDRNLLYLLIGLVLSFVSLAAPVQLDGNHITLFWATEAVLLLWLAQRSGIELVRIGSVLVNFLMLGSLMLNIQNTYGGNDPLPILVNKGFITMFFVIMSMFLSLYLIRRERKTDFLGFSISSVKTAFSLLPVALTYFLFFLEISYQMDRQGFDNENITVACATYTSFFALVLLLVSKRVNLRPLVIVATAAGFLVILFYPAAPHLATIETRNLALTMNITPVKNVFYLHFLNTAFVAGLLFYLRKPIASLLNMKEAYPYYLWLSAFIGIFILSAELDHISVLSGYTGNPGSIHDAVRISQKVAYPIAWGICSFCMVAVGLRTQQRQLRIIGLVLFGVTIIKLISLGFYSDSQAGKIAAYIISGIVLLVVSFMYQKLKKMVMDDELNNPGNEKKDLV